jgi:hypothetical protein
MIEVLTVLLHDLSSTNQLLQVWTDDGLQQHFAGVDKAATNAYSNRFSADIVNKLDRS